MTAQAVVGLVVIAGGIALVALIASAVRVIKQYERGVHFRLGRVIAVREPGLRLILPIIDRLWRVSMRIVTMPIQSQGIITRDNVSVDIAAVAYYRVVDARRAVVTIENVAAVVTGLPVILTVLAATFAVSLAIVMVMMFVPMRRYPRGG